MKSKTIIGLDLGVSSIGWALVNEKEDKTEIVNLGVRIVPLSTDEKNEFSRGNAISKNQSRTLKRTQRKGYDRYQLRRKRLIAELSAKNMLPTGSLFSLNAIDLYGLRHKSVSEKIKLEEFGRIMLHLNQKRGYKSSLKEENSVSKKEGDYVAAVKGRHHLIREKGITVGQYFYEGLQTDVHYRIKEQIFPREAYIEEFKAIYDCQQIHYPEMLTNEFRDTIINEVIYYQRPLKSQKGLVSICEFEGNWRQNSSGKRVFVGPKVAPRSSPLTQVVKIWESINSIKLKGKRGQEYEITLDQKKLLFNHLDVSEKLSESQLFKILNLSKEDGFAGNAMTKNGIQGNDTKVAILKVLRDNDTYSQMLKFALTENTKHYLVNSVDGEQIERLMIDASFEKEPLYQLWHCIYSIQNDEDLIRTLESKFGISVDIAQSLAKIDFTKQGFSNKSAKCMRKIIPFLQSGLVYSDAMEYAGYNHSNSMTKAENSSRVLPERLPQLQRNSLRQPVVEKILNQMVNVVNAIIEKYGRPDEIRVELARELKSSRDERNRADKNNRSREADNKKIAEMLEKDYGVKANKRNIDKYKMYRELDGISLYSGRKVELAAFLRGDQVDIEHILPKSRIFDDSLQNKTICEQQENRNKGNMTAYDYMQTKSEDEFNAYLERVEMMFKLNKITKSKRDKLLTPATKIPNDFIERQLRQTQYIAKKSVELLNEICFNVYATSGQVTDYLKHQWGWDEVLMNLRIEMYKAKGYLDLIEQYEVLQGGQIKIKERIKGWTKRDDHRHHAIDALVIACTKQGVIQRLNRLNQEVIKFEGQTQTDALKADESLKDFILKMKPFTTKEVEQKAAGVLISFKAGKKAAVRGVRKVKIDGKRQQVQKGVIIPRGELHEEAIYAQIKRYDGTKLKDFSVKKYNLGVGEQGFVFSGKETYELKIKVDKKTGIENMIVVDKIKNVLDSIVDNGVRKIILQRLNRGFTDNKDYRSDVKKALSNLKDMENDPVWYNRENGNRIKSIRMFTGLTSTRKIEVGSNEISPSYTKYVLPKNNHHIAIYLTENGFKDITISFWDAVNRFKYNLPVIINNPQEVWSNILNSKMEIPEDVLSNLPLEGWNFLFSMQQNEMFVFNMEEEQLKQHILERKFDVVSENLYRFQKTESGYKAVFRHHLATTIDKKNEWKGYSSFHDFDGIKVKINSLGEISVI